ncbi:type II secretion system F family protein [Sphingomonas sp. ASV193]|uniref:type II secretion system F family protein n=1 Tax=Sphingomonas sp. ASV193 TaxID=3144405 RepID=UPI0032E8D95A
MTELLLQNPWLRYSILAALFIVVAVVAYLLVSSLDTQRVFRERLADGQRPSPLVRGDPATLRMEDREGPWLRLIRAIERSGLSLADTRDDKVRKLLVAAGYTQAYAPRAYVLLRMTLVIVLPIAILLMIWLGGSNPSVTKMYFQLVGAALFGLYVPTLYVRAKADRRKLELINGFPDALDLLLVCVEAGLGLESAMNRVGMEMVRSHPMIAEHFANVVLELRAGRSREEALRRMADRADADEIRAFATLLIQSSKLGTSIGQTLRVYAAEMREKRRMKAEEKAHRLPVLISIPLVACMLPTMIGVLMLPAVIRIVRTMAGH